MYEPKTCYILVKDTHMVVNTKYNHVVINDDGSIKRFNKKQDAELFISNYELHNFIIRRIKVLELDELFRDKRI